VAEKKPKIVSTKKEREEKESDVLSASKSMREMYSGNESSVDDWENSQMQSAKEAEDSATREYLTQSNDTLQVKK
jgi:DNA-binding ferritin-like protein